MTQSEAFAQAMKELGLYDESICKEVEKEVELLFPGNRDAVIPNGAERSHIDGLKLMFVHVWNMKPEASRLIEQEIVRKQSRKN